MGLKCRISVEVLENGYEVEIPDIDAMNKAEAKAKKDRPGMVPSIYSGDYTKKYAAKTADEVIKLVKPALKNLPQSTYAEAFAEAAKHD